MLKVGEVVGVDVDVLVIIGVDVGCAVDVLVGSGVKVRVGVKVNEELGGGGWVSVISACSNDSCPEAGEHETKIIMNNTRHKSVNGLFLGIADFFSSIA